MTFYLHMTFPELLEALKQLVKKINLEVINIETHLALIKTNSYWYNNVSIDFRMISEEALSFYKSTANEISDISNEISVMVETHHINRLNSIINRAQQFNIDIGYIWHNRYDNKQYGNKNFEIVDWYAYGNTRDLAVLLSNLNDLTNRMNDFIGKTNNIKKNNPWISGSFYVFIPILVILALSLTIYYIPWIMFPILVIAVLLIMGLIGILQLKNDNIISDNVFFSLFKELLKKIPLLKK